jgi:hypothetical protein
MENKIFWAAFHGESLPDLRIWISDEGGDPNAMLEGAARGGHIAFIHEAINLGATKLNMALNAAMLFNREDCVIHLLSNFVDLDRYTSHDREYNGITKRSIESHSAYVGAHNNVALAETLLRKYGIRPDYMLRMAASYDHIEMVRYLLQGQHYRCVKDTRIRGCYLTAITQHGENSSVAQYLSRMGYGDKPIAPQKTKTGVK